MKLFTDLDKDRDEYGWLFCNNKSPHDQENSNLMLTQIIAGDALHILARKVHEMRALWNIPQYCNCSEFSNEKLKSNDLFSDAINELLKSQPNCLFRDEKSNKQIPHTESDDSDESDDSEMSANLKSDKSALRSLLTFEDKSSVQLKENAETQVKLDASTSNTNTNSASKEDDFVKTSQLRHYVSRTKRNVVFLPTRIMTLAQSRTIYPKCPHQWLCDGKLLRLLDPTCPNNYKIFQEQWKRGQPVVVSSVDKQLNNKLWHPNSFSHEFGEEKFDLVNCISGNLLPNQPLKKFWDGFDNVSKRLRDESGNPMLLKLKDWPPSDDFSEILPSRYEPIKYYLKMGNSPSKHRIFGKKFTGKIFIAFFHVL
jgi:[histone H3]-dimethyl-L-lysine9 demethylase